jgi:hypothetical protein
MRLRERRRKRRTRLAGSRRRRRGGVAVRCGAWKRRARRAREAARSGETKTPSATACVRAQPGAQARSRECRGGAPCTDCCPPRAQAPPAGRRRAAQRVLWASRGNHKAWAKSAPRPARSAADRRARARSTAAAAAVPAPGRRRRSGRRPSSAGRPAFRPKGTGRQRGRDARQRACVRRRRRAAPCAARRAWRRGERGGRLPLRSAASQRTDRALPRRARYAAVARRRTASPRAAPLACAGRRLLVAGAQGIFESAALVGTFDPRGSAARAERCAQRHVCACNSVCAPRSALKQQQSAGNELDDKLQTRACERCASLRAPRTPAARMGAAGYIKHRWWHNRARARGSARYSRRIQRAQRFELLACARCSRQRRGPEPWVGRVQRRLQVLVEQRVHHAVVEPAAPESKRAQNCRAKSASHPRQRARTCTGRASRRATAG